MRSSLPLLRLLISAACLFACAPALRAQDTQRPEGIGPEPERSVTQYGYETYDDRRGLPANAVQAMAQSTDGYLWIATQDGVVRFDGSRFTTYSREVGPALGRPYLWALAADPDGGMWIGSEEGGLARHYRGRFTAYGKADGLPDEWVRRLLVDRQGTLWIGTMTGGLARRPRGGRITAVDLGLGDPGKAVLALAQDGEGGVWMGTPAGLTQVAPRGRTFTVQDGLPSNIVLSIAPARAGGVWVGTNHGVVRVAGGEVTESFGKDDGLPAWSALGLHEDRHGALWVATPKGLARRGQDGRIETVPQGRLPRGAVDVLFADREGSLWVGTPAGMARLRETPMIPFTSADGLASDLPTAVLQDRSGAMWIGSFDAGVTRIRGTEVDTFSVANGKLNANFVFSLAEERAGSILVGTGAGMVRIRGDQSEILSPALPPPASGMARAILEDRQGRLWVAGFDGLTRVSPGPPRHYDTDDGLADNAVWTIHEDPDGTIWVSTRRGISRLLPNDRFQTYTTAHGLADATVLALHRGSDGSLWIANGAGLGRLRDGRIRNYGKAQGLCDETLMQVLEDDHQRLWISSFRGVFAVPIAAFDSVDAGHGRLPCRLFGREDGMPNREAQGAVNPAGWRASDGRLWFPTLAGMVVIDPDRAEPRLPQPPVVIEEILADGRMLAAGTRVIPAGTDRLEIRFTANSLAAPDQVRFRYRLGGGEWVDAGAQRAAYFTNLAPGDYTLRVSAYSASGAWDPVDTTLALRIAPLWYQTRWARLLGLLTVLSLLGGAYWWRVHTLKRRTAALALLVEERTRAEKRFRDLFDNASDAVFTTDLDGRFTALNRRAEELTGYTLDEARGISLRDLLPHTEMGERTLREWLDGTAAPQRAVEIVARDGSRIPVEVSTRRVEEDGRPVGMQAVARDVRERVALEGQLRQSQKMDAVGRLAGGVAHDFNNLLTIIKGSSDLLLMDLPLGDPVREDVEQITAAADRAAGLTRQLLAFSRKQVLQPRVLDLNRVVDGVEPMLRRLIGEDIAIACITGAEPARVLADPGQLEQVLVNLVVNARDAMPEGGTITLETAVIAVDDVVGAPVRTASGRAAVLSVTDTGVGMDSATQARIFEPFFTTKDPGKGTGLGLSTVYGIVRQAEGTIQVTSAPGHGTTFRVFLPIATAAEAEPEVTGGLAAGRGTETVLLVEDEDAVRGLAHRILLRQGYSVLDARHGVDALGVAEEHQGPIHLLLTDLVMPQMGGRELADRIREARPEIAVLFTSGYTDDEVLRRGLLDSHQAFVEKPFTAESLSRAVRAVLDGSEDSLEAPAA